MAKESLSEEAMRMKRNKIILVAAELFLEKGIDSVKMTDIADASGIGVASLYRYFGTRTNIVIEAGPCSGKMYSCSSPIFFPKMPSGKKADWTVFPDSLISL